MPLIQVDLERELFDAQQDTLSDAIHEAQIEALGIPADDRFQVFRPREPHQLKFDPGFNGVERRSLLLIHVTMVHHYSPTTKDRFHRAVVAKLQALGIRPEDILICLVENGFEDWYAGRFDEEAAR